MGLSIKNRADAISTYRFVSVTLMETLARWVPSAPELEAKVMLGRHIWDFAQHADRFGHRTSELRVALHNNRKPVEPYAALLGDIEQISATPDRVAAMYGAVIPDLERRYRDYLAATDTLLDEPSVRLLEIALSDFDRMRTQREELLAERPDLGGAESTEKRFQEALNAISLCVDYRIEATEPV